MINSVKKYKLCPCVTVFIGYLSFFAFVLEIGFAECEETTSEDEFVPVFPPQPLDHPYPRLLHERDIIHYKDSWGSFVSVGSGTYANVTLGEMRWSGLHVVLKSFKNSPFRVILQEIRLHRYAEQIGIAPRLIGLLPSGPLAGNISLVYEYVPFSKSLSYWLDEYETLSTVQWLHVCQQTALMLLRLHQHEVLFNDLHRGNVLLQIKDNMLRTYFIDFGLATYRSGKVYSESYGGFTKYGFIAPEFANHFPSTEATDTFSLGYVFLKIAHRIKTMALFHLAYWCMAYQDTERPSLVTVIARLDNILFEASLKHFQNMHTNDIRMKEDNVAFLGKNYLILQRDNLAVVTQSFLVCLATPSPMSRDTISDFDPEKAKLWSWLTQNEGLLSERCQVDLHVLDEHDLVKEMDEDISWLSRSQHDAIRLARLKLTNRTVIVKEFYSVPFETIRKEACRTGLFGEKNVAPKVLGILVEYKNMDDTAFIQEMFGNGVSLTEFIKLSFGFEWDEKGLERAASGEITSDSPEGSCPYKKSDSFMKFLNDWYSGTSKRKSCRRSILERISMLMIQHLASVHNSGYLINNFRTNNILVKWTESNTKTPDIDIRLIDLAMTSPVSLGLNIKQDSNYLSHFGYLAPEVVQGQRTSRLSDIYSLCFALYQTMIDYFPDHEMPISFVKTLKTFRNFEQSFDRSTFCVISFDHHSQKREYIVNKSKTATKADTYFSKYHSLLLKCLCGHPTERPQLKDILHAFSLSN